MRTPKLVPPCRATIRAVSLLTVVGLMAACADGPASPMDPGSPDAARNPTAVLTVTSPIDGQTLTGTVQFRASVNWSPITSYDVYWQDGGGGVQAKMITDPTSTFKQAAVDVSSWVSGIHTLIFTAKSHNKTLDTKSVTVTVNGTTPPPPPPSSGNPLAGAAFWVDPNSNAAKTVQQWQNSRPDDALQMQKIASHSQADWFGGWNTDVQAAVDARTTTIVGAGRLPVFVAYNIPNRDCGGYSAGGAQTADAYKSWIRSFAAGLANRRAVVVLEPDGTSSTTCLNATELQTRYDLLADAINVLKAANAIVYLDAGNSAWIGASEQASRLTKAGIANADGFSLNVSNYQYTTDTESYGTTISGLVNGKHFIIDTSRNGLGPVAGEWCNVLGRGLGSFATTTTDNTLVDAYLWIKAPGESDGTCNGGPAAGAWWADYALGLAQNMPALLASQ